jgi:hypothetical protein
VPIWLTPCSSAQWIVAMDSSSSGKPERIHRRHVDVTSPEDWQTLAAWRGTTGATCRAGSRGFCSTPAPLRPADGRSAPAGGMAPDRDVAEASRRPTLEARALVPGLQVVPLATVSVLGRRLSPT